MDVLCRQFMPGRTWVALSELGWHKVSCHLSSSTSKKIIPWYRTQLDIKDPQTKSRLATRGGRVSIFRDPGVVNVNKMTKEKLCQHLVQNVVYMEGPLVAISKPAGLSITGNQEEVSVSSLLADLRQRLGISADLHVVKAAPKESSGLVLLSTCHVTTKRIEEFYGTCRKEQMPVSTYCAVTVGVPSPPEGEVNAALKVERIGDLDLVVPVMSPSKGSLERREVKRTQSHYKVLDSADGCALLQLQPMSVFQAQLLVHSTLLFCPILGDHTYSARVGKVLGEKIYVPVDIALPRTQLLEEKILHKMHILQQQMHRMPLHLHLQHLLIPGHSAGADPALLTAPLPPFFQRTLQLLKLKMKMKPALDKKIPVPG